MSKKSPVLFIGSSSLRGQLSVLLSKAPELSLVCSGYSLSRSILHEIEVSHYKVILYELSARSRISYLDSLRQLNGHTPLIILSNKNSLLKMVKDKHSDMLFDCLLYPEHKARLLHSISLACEIHEFRRSRKRIKAKTLAKLDQMSIIFEAGQTITSTLKMDGVIESIMNSIRNLIQAEAWSLLMVDEKTHQLVFRDSRGVSGNKMREFTLNMGQGIAGWVAQKKEPLIVNDAQNDPRFYREIDAQTHFITRSILCAPIIFKGKLLAVLEIINRLDGKPFINKDLKTIEYLLDAAAIAMENATLFDQAEALAVTDELTTLYNARFLNNILETEISRSKRFGSKLSFIFMDMDHFKKVNDNYGHLAGREVLREVAFLMKKHFRETDLLARYGGDEFVVVMPHTDTQETYEIAEKLRKEIAAYHFLARLDHEVRLTASFGIATYPEHASSKDELIKMADVAMFQAKGNCRNTVYITSQKENVCEFPE